MNVVVSNRDLLRKYKELKDKLVSGEIEEVEIEQKNNVVIKMYAEKKMTSMEKLLKMIKEKPLKGIKRPEQDIF